MSVLSSLCWALGRPVEMLIGTSPWVLFLRCLLTGHRGHGHISLGRGVFLSPSSCDWYQADCSQVSFAFACPDVSWVDCVPSPSRVFEVVHSSIVCWTSPLTCEYFLFWSFSVSPSEFASISRFFYFRDRVFLSMQIWDRASSYHSVCDVVHFQSACGRFFLLM